MPQKYKYKYKKRVKRTRKTPMGRRRKTSTRPTRYFVIRRDSNRDTTNQCHFTIAGDADGIQPVLTTTFNLSDMVAQGEMVSLFDSYRINSIAWRWVLVKDPSTTTVVPSAFLRIVQACDYNDQVAPASSSQLRQYANSQEIVFKGNQSATKWYYMKPSCLQLLYVTSVSSATAPLWNQWIDTSLNTVPHYGLKYAIENLYTGATLRLEVKMNVSFKGIS